MVQTSNNGSEDVGRTVPVIYPTCNLLIEVRGNCGFLQINYSPSRSKVIFVGKRATMLGKVTSPSKSPIQR